MSIKHQSTRSELLSLLVERSTGEDDLKNAEQLRRCVIFNTESVYYFLSSAKYQEYVRSCDHIFLDGSALQLYLRVLGYRVKRFHGPDLLQALLRSNVFDKHEVAFVGDPRKAKLLERSLPIDSALSMGYFDIVDADSNIDKLGLGNLEFKERTIFLICLGLPKQEIVAHKISQKLPDGDGHIYLPLGAAIDFLTGEKKRSSSHWTRMGLEWLPRLIREPRMFVRIMRSLLGLAQLSTGIGSAKKMP